MPRFAANLMFLYQEMAFLDRIDAAADAGFHAVEYQFPYGESLAEMQERLLSRDLQMVLINAPAGDWAAGERGIAALPSRVQEFQDTVGEAISYARELMCPRVHVMAGLVGEGMDQEAMMMTYVDNLRFAADACAEFDIKCLIEPLNATDVPGYLLSGNAQARAVMAVAAHTNLFLQYDIYHAMMSDEDPMDGIPLHLEVIEHMQVAAPYGRHEPEGEGFRDIFELTDNLGYTGWIGCEYTPRDGTNAGLGWATAYGIAA